MRRHVRMRGCVRGRLRRYACEVDRKGVYTLGLTERVCMW